VNPKIIFQRASPIYEKNLLKIEGFVMPTEAVFKRKIRALESRWSKWGALITAELNKVAGLTWPEQDIRCYITAGTRMSFSHPLTLKLHSSMDDTFDTFTHELIHRLLNNPYHPKRFKKARADLMEEYKNESLTTRHHILLHAIHSHILMKFFGLKRLQRATAFVKNPDYIRSWEIVNGLGYQNILKQVFKS